MVELELTAGPAGDARDKIDRLRRDLAAQRGELLSRWHTRHAEPVRQARAAARRAEELQYRLPE
ncbi:MAG: hypothetical protein ACK41F_13065 [Fimbriimonadaceae bacterium]